MDKITKTQILSLCGMVNNQTKDLNCGGCGVFAWLVGKCLENFKNVEYVHVKILRNWWDSNKELNEKTIPKNVNDPMEWARNGIYFRHIVLEVKLKKHNVFYIDSDGEFTNYQGFYDGYVQLSHIEHIVKIPDPWNREFNRNQIPKIIRTIKQFFSNEKSICHDLIIKQWKLKPSC